jgi:osmotically-inducible protein OsmY
MAMHSRLIHAAGAALVLIATAMPSVAAQQPGSITEQQTASQVEDRLLDHGIRGVTVSVHDGTVTLSGTVRSLWAREEAVKQARKVDDVREVVSTLTVRPRQNDRAIADAVAAAIRGYVYFTIFDDVDVQVAAGVATLTGFVTMPYKADAMIELASRIDGVQQLIDRLELLPVSRADDEIRYAAAVRIYDDPLFWNYAIQVNPPIHIIVRYGRVTLTGAVMSEVERRTAEQIVREIFGVLSVENRLRLEDGDSD